MSLGEMTARAEHRVGAKVPSVLGIAERTIAGWTEAWGLPGLEREVTVEESPRLRSSLARCAVASRRIRLHPALRSQPRALREAVLCHELAHIAAYTLHGPTIRPHGPEWRALMIAAGFTPSVRLSARGIPNVAAGPTPAANRVATPPAPAAPRLPYRHRCPVCQAVRWARRPVPRWRCRACVEAGLEGKLVVERALEREPDIAAAASRGVR